MKPDGWTATGMVEARQLIEKLQPLVEESKGSEKKRFIHTNRTLQWIIILVEKNTYLDWREWFLSHDDLSEIAYHQM